MMNNCLKTVFTISHQLVKGKRRGLGGRPFSWGMMMSSPAASLSV